MGRPSASRTRCEPAVTHAERFDLAQSRVLQLLRGGLCDEFARADPHIRRVVLYGSHASGRSGPGSDVDIAVFVEPPPGVVWGSRDLRAERERLRPLCNAAAAAALGPRVRVDLSVRTLDQDAEARDVVGGVEHWAATTGVVLYARAPDRLPVVRRPPSQVVRDHTRMWVAYAVRTLQYAEAARARVRGRDSADVRTAVILAVRRACLAVCAYRQVADNGAGGWPTPKRAPLSATVARMASAAPALAAELTSMLTVTSPSPEVGRRVIARVIAYLSASDAALAAALALSPLDGAPPEGASAGAAPLPEGERPIPHWPAR